MEWTKKGQELEEYLSTLSISDLKRIIIDFGVYATKDKKDYIDAKLHYEEADKELKNKYRKENEDLRENVQYYRKRESKALKQSEFWEGKFKIVKHENNQLRKKLTDNASKNSINN